LNDIRLGPANVAREFKNGLRRRHPWGHAEGAHGDIQGFDLLADLPAVGHRDDLVLKIFSIHVREKLVQHHLRAPGSETSDQMKDFHL